jgi:hypothetical protein
MKIEKTSPDEGYVTVTEEEFLEQIADGLCCQEVLKPGRNKFIRGGIRKLYPNLDLTKATVRYEVTLAFTPDIYDYFKQWAERSGEKSMRELMEKILTEAAEQEKKSSLETNVAAEERLTFADLAYHVREGLLETNVAAEERLPMKPAAQSSTKPVAKPRRRAA